MDDGDCLLVDDCCTCAVFPPGEGPPPCDLQECFATVCAGQGFGNPQAACVGGVCRFQEVGCDPDLVLCDAEPPVCPEGWRPRVSPAGCWDGCVPIEACDTVTSCDDCHGDEVCVVTNDLAGTRYDCEPWPVGCDAQDPCGCAPAFCPEGHSCEATGAGRVECTCLDCGGP